MHSKTCKTTKKVDPTSAQTMRYAGPPHGMVNANKNSTANSRFKKVYLFPSPKNLLQRNVDNLSTFKASTIFLLTNSALGFNDLLL